MEELFAMQHGFNVCHCKLLILDTFLLPFAMIHEQLHLNCLGNISPSLHCLPLSCTDIELVIYALKFFIPLNWAINALTVIVMLVAISNTGLL